MSDDVAEQALPDLAAIEADLGAVGRALTRLDEGTYGHCGSCGAVIAEEDLEADPLLERCRDHRADDVIDPGSPQTAWGSGGVASN